jgi:polyketide synthase 5
VSRATALAESDDTAISPDEGGYAFEALLRHDRAHSGYAPVMSTPWFADFARRSNFAELFQSCRPSRKDASEFLAELNGLPVDEWITRLRRLISDQVTRILRRPIDPDRALSEYGVDSLGNLELRTLIETETGIHITSSDITTVQDLATLLCRKLAPSHAASPSGAP